MTWYKVLFQRVGDSHTAETVLLQIRHYSRIHDIWMPSRFFILNYSMAWDQSFPMSEPLSVCLSVSIFTGNITVINIIKTNSLQELKTVLSLKGHNINIQVSG